MAISPISKQMTQTVQFQIQGVKINPKNLQWQFALKITIYLRVSMKLLLTLKILHRAANLQKMLLTKSPPPCQARERPLRYPTSWICIGAPATCLRHIPCRTTSDFLLRKSMKTLFTLFSFAFLAVIVQGGEESGKKVEPLPCKDRGSKASCNRYMKKDNFEELCKENRRIGRYLCCKTCAEKLGVEVNEDGKFKDFGTFTYYEPTCPALEDRGNHTICEMIKHGSEVYKCDQSEAQAACAKTCNLTSVRMCTPVGPLHVVIMMVTVRLIDTENVVQTHESIKFLAYNNVPPGIPNIKTKSNSKGVIIISTAANSAAAWVVHTIPGFPTAKTPYNWPASETARGHLLICLTVSKSQINAICFSHLSIVNLLNECILPFTSSAASLLLVQTVIHYNDIPETKPAGMPYFKKLAEGQTPIIPPFRSRHTIRTQNAGAPVTVHIYSKSESSKY
ncbi:hypothetical protein T05_11922, partial [Trichinella murrelli]